MTSYFIKADNAPYYDLEISFADQTFVQSVIFPEKGERLAAAMQAYAEEYGAAWMAANDPVNPDPE